MPRRRLGRSHHQRKKALSGQVRNTSQFRNARRPAREQRVVRPDDVGGRESHRRGCADAGSRCRRSRGGSRHLPPRASGRRVRRPRRCFRGGATGSSSRGASSTLILKPRQKSSPISARIARTTSSEKRARVLERAAVLVLAVVDRRAQELREQHPVRARKLDAVEARLAHPPRSGRELRRRRPRSRRRSATGRRTR